MCGNALKFPNLSSNNLSELSENIWTLYEYAPHLSLLIAKYPESLLPLLNPLSTWLDFDKGEGGDGKGAGTNEGQPRQTILGQAYPVVWKTGEYQKTRIPFASCVVGLHVVRARMKTTLLGQASIRVARTSQDTPGGATGCSHKLFSPTPSSCRLSSFGFQFLSLSAVELGEGGIERRINSCRPQIAAF